mmetsp:Transcript_30490/g.30985  ORF Transcript_30490/g.30985 Transcript_30490/m.30985 type:complete len:96 (-) Transcript_30490:267-554(-)
MKARYLGSVVVEEYKYSNKDRHLLKGVTTRGCKANEGKIFTIGSPTLLTMYNIVDTIFNKQKQKQQQQQNKNIYNNENRETVCELISFYPGRNYR